MIGDKARRRCDTRGCKMTFVARPTYWVSVFLLVPLSTMHLGCRQTEPQRAPANPMMGNLTAGAAPNAASEPVHLTPEQRADVQTSVALSLEKQGKSEEAIKAYSRIAREHDSPLALHRLGVLSDQKGDFERSITYYQKARQLDPHNAELLCDMGYSFYLQRRWSDSEVALHQAIDLAPQLSRARNNLGLLLARMGRNEEALEQFKAAGCGEAEARVNLAFALLTSHELEEARKQAELALQADATFEPAKTLLMTIKSQSAKLAQRPTSSDRPFVLASANVAQPARQELSPMVQRGQPPSAGASVLKTEQHGDPVGNAEGIKPGVNQPSASSGQQRDSGKRPISDGNEFYRVYLNAH